MATEEIQFLDDELQSIYSEVRKGIELLGSMQGTADKKLEKFSQLTARVSRARTVFQSFKVELKELRDDEKKSWQAVRVFVFVLMSMSDACPFPSEFVVTQFPEREGTQPVHNQAGFRSQNGEINLGTQRFDGRKRKYDFFSLIPFLNKKPYSSFCLASFFYSLFCLLQSLKNSIPTLPIPPR
jgi:hypothetical protein